MLIPLSIIVDCLSQWRPQIQPSSRNLNNYQYRGVQLYYSGQTEFSSSILYVLPSDLTTQLPNSLSGASFVCSTPMCETQLSDALFIILSFQDSAEKLCALISNYMCKYFTWDDMTTQSILSGCDEQRLLDLSEDFLCNPMIILDPTFFCRAASKNITEDDALYYDLKLRGSPSTESMQVLVRHNEKKQCFRYGHFRSGQVYRIGIGPIGIEEIYIDISIDNELALSLNMRFSRNPLTPGAIDFLGLFAEKLRTLLTLHNTSKFYSRQLSFNEYIFPQIISGNKDALILVQESDIFKNDYIVVTSEPHSIRMVAQKAASIIQGAYSFGFEHRIFIYIPVDLHDAHSPLFIDNQHLILRKLGEEFSQRLATSGPFEDIALLKTACQQAIQSYNLSYSVYPLEGQDTPRFLVEYSEIAFLDMIQEYLAHPLSSYAPKGFRELKQGDTENGTNYCDFLAEFIANGSNVAKTAQKHFRHKNSVIYRLSKIKDLYGLKFSDFKDQLLFLIAYIADKLPHSGAES